MTPEIVARMEALVRKVANGDTPGVCAEALTIVALLPEPVDPDLLLAREVVEKHYEDHDSAAIRAGDWDTTFQVRVALDAIKAARA